MTDTPTPEREPLDLAAIWERSERYQAMWDAVIGAPSEAHAFAAALSADDVRPLWDEVVRLTADPRAERTPEPATAEDVEPRQDMDAWRTVERAIYSVAGSWILHDDVPVLTDAILAALDLPGREKALREEIEELAGELAEERTLHQQTIAEREENRVELKAAMDNVRAKFNDLAGQAMTLAVENEHLRAQLDRDEAERWKRHAEHLAGVRAEVAEEIARAIEEHSDNVDPTRQSWRSRVFDEAVAIAWQHATADTPPAADGAS